MAEQFSIALPDGSAVGIADAHWETLVSAGLSDGQKLRVLRHSDGRVVIFGQAGGRTAGEMASSPRARDDIESCLRRVCEQLELPLDLVHSCLRRLPARV